MGKLSHKRARGRRRGAIEQLSRLRDERRKLRSRLVKLDRTIETLSARNGQRRAPTAAEIDRWLEQISADFPDVPALPVDFSRKDLYDDHD